MIRQFIEKGGRNGGPQPGDKPCDTEDEAGESWFEQLTRRPQLAEGMKQDPCSQCDEGNKDDDREPENAAQRGCHNQDGETSQTRAESCGKLTDGKFSRLLRFSPAML